MSLFDCGCDCDQPASQRPCECTDPGISTTLRHLGGYDYKLCPTRLQSQAGALVARQNGSGAFEIAFTTSPQVLYPTLDIAVGTVFTGLLAATGGTGLHRRLNPTEAGFLGTDASGNWMLKDAPAATIPDPLTVNTLNAGVGAITTLNVSGTPTFTGLASDTVTQQVGLNAANQLVKGSVAQVSKAMYFENATRTTAAFPNATITTSTSPVVIGNELYDPDGIAHVQDSQTVVIDQAGSYEIEWSGTFSFDNQGSSVLLGPALWLAINSQTNIVSWGDGKQGSQSNNRVYTSHGKHLVDLNAGDKIYVVANGSVNTTPGKSGLNGVSLYLTKFR